MAGSACVHCRTPLTDFTARHVCPSCGKPQPVDRASEDFFFVLGIARGFTLDRSDLESRYFRVSRALHPDRFTGADPGIRALSLERMSFLNEAYDTLRDPEALRSYILKLLGREVSKGKPPATLAEAWFEVQEAVMDDPESGASRIRDFEGTLDQEEKRTEAELRAAEQEADRAFAGGTAPADALLDRLSSGNQALSYLRSMRRDVARLAARVGGHA